MRGGGVKYCSSDTLVCNNSCTDIVCWSNFCLYCGHFLFKSFCCRTSWISFTFAMAAAGLLDDAMTKFGGKAWSFCTVDSPACFTKNEDDIEKPITGLDGLRCRGT